VGRFIRRRLVHSVLTVFGVMLITFILFRIIAGDVSAAYVNQKVGREARYSFLAKHGLDLPSVINIHSRLILWDTSEGPAVFTLRSVGSDVFLRGVDLHRTTMASGQVGYTSLPLPLVGEDDSLHNYLPDEDAAAMDTSGLHITLNTSDTATLFFAGLHTFSDLMQAIETHPLLGKSVSAAITEWDVTQLFKSQFFMHLWESLSFSGRSYATDQTVLEIIGERGIFSLALTLPAFALGWLLAMSISCLVAYYRDTAIDRIGVFLAVLGMCIPYLAWMILGQWLIFQIAPDYAVGLKSPLSVYGPVLISVVAGLGTSVRFYRTIILDQVHADYVRTARAKGLSLPVVLYVHVLKNGMLPILTNLITAIPFLIMGSLLLERFFGIPGLGDLLLSSITNRDVPVITGLVFLSAVLYTLSLIVTDILYAVFDPRVRLQ